MTLTTPWRFPAAARALARDRGGVAFVEFAYALPIITILGAYGLEATNLALANLRVSQIASNLADTAARVGENSGLSEKQIRESDINDAFQAVRIQGQALGITEHGRVVLSSLERNKDGGQWIHWQRCVGRVRVIYESVYRKDQGKNGTGFAGIGPAADKITAPADSAVMFAEVGYKYQPLISGGLMGTPDIRARAAFLVREQRDLDDADNPANPDPESDASECSKYSL